MSRPVASPPADALIVGGGIMGCSAAYHLAKAGCRVVLLEKADIGQEASGRNLGAVRQQLRHPLELPLAREAVRRWQQLDEELDFATEYRTVGNLMVTYREEELNGFQEEIDRQRALGLEVRLLTGKELRDVAPGLSEAVAGGMYSPEDGQANPQRATLAFATAAKRAGARILTGVRVESIRLENGRVAGVLTDAGEFESPTVLVTAGVWSPFLCRPLGLDFSVAPWLHQVLVTTRTSRVTYPYIRCTGPRVGAGQTADGTVMFNVGPPENLGFLSALTHDRITRAAVETARLLPGARGAQVVRMWSGWFEVSPDDLPIMGPVESAPGLFVAAGYSGHGFALGPVIGDLMSQLILEGRTSLPIDRFSPSRFADSKGRSQESGGKISSLWALTAPGTND